MRRMGKEFHLQHSTLCDTIITSNIFKNFPLDQSSYSKILVNNRNLAEIVKLTNNKCLIKTDLTFHEHDKLW